MSGVLLLAGCNSDGSNAAPTGNGVYDAIGKLDLAARFGGGQVRDGGSPRPVPGQGIVVVGSEGGVRSDGGAGGSSAAGGGGSFQVDFENAPIATVAKSIISDTLGLGLTVDPRIDGRISLSSGRPLTRNELLTTFENALRAFSVSMVKDANGYRLIPGAEAVGSGRVEGSRNPEAGFGVSVLPLRFVSAENIVKLLDSFVSKPGAMRVDASRNLLIIQGSADERRIAIENALSFDQDFMRGQSVGVYPIANTAPDTVISELQRIMDAGENGANKGFVQFQPVARLNAILVIAKQPQVMRTAASWIRRLDRVDAGSGATKVYRVKHGNAKTLAALINDAIGGGGGGAGGADPIDSASGRVSISAAASGSGGSTSGGFGGAGGSGVPGASTSGGAAGGAGGGAGSVFGTLQGGGRSGAGSASGGIGGSSGGGGGFGQTASRSGGVFGSSSAGGGGLAGGSGSGGSGGGGSGRARVTADVTTNSLLITADRETHQVIENILKQIDRAPLQVAIEATIAEVTLNEGLQYGVQFYLKNSKGSFGFTGLANETLGRVLPGYNFLLGARTDPSVVLDALNNRTSVKVLSNPSVVVLDNQVASIQVGDQIPVATTQASLVGTTSTGLTNAAAIPVANNIDYRNTGVILRVLPRISANGNVTLDVEQEISNVAQNGSQGSLTPTVSQRHVRSSISVSSGQTVMLAGLISNNETGGRSGIPFLSNIQFLGDLLSRNQTGINRTELIVFIRPQIIGDAIDAQAIAEAMRKRMLPGPRQVR